MDETKPLELFDPDAVWKRETVERYRAEELLRSIFKSGELVYDLPDIETIRAYCARQIERQWMRSNALKIPQLLCGSVPEAPGISKQICCSRQKHKG